MLRSNEVSTEEKSRVRKKGFGEVRGTPKIAYLLKGSRISSPIPKVSDLAKIYHPSEPRVLVLVQCGDSAR